MLTGNLVDTNSYLIATALLPRLLGVIYFFVFGAFLFQIKGLIGKNGILPLVDFVSFLNERLKKKKLYYVPMIFWWSTSDRTLMLAMGLGTFFSFLLACNFYPFVLLPILFILHLSLMYAGQDFLSFGWETFMLEITFNTFFVCLATPANPLVWISINILLFRFHFQAGISKLLSRDPSWRNLTAIYYHYQSQPLPNTIAWYIHKLPMGFHKFSTFFMFFAELVAPFGIFGNEEVRFVTFIFLVGLQLAIWATGNFSYLNHLTIILCVILLSDHYLEPIFGPPIPLTEPSPILSTFLYCVGAALIFLQTISLANYFWPRADFRKILDWVAPFHIINRYGIFAVMTTHRYEIVIEGSDDGVHWKEYLFRYKPSELTRRPRRISPYQPRLDWQAWFLPFNTYDSEWWFQCFLSRLLLGSPEVINLLRHNPFPDNPPIYIRALMYEYIFSDAETKKKLGLWWTRKYIGPYSPILSRQK